MCYLYPCWLSTSCHVATVVDSSIWSCIKPYVTFHVFHYLACKVMKTSHADIIRDPSCGCRWVSCCPSFLVNEEKLLAFQLVLLIYVFLCGGEGGIANLLGDFGRFDSWQQRNKKLVRSIRTSATGYLFSWLAQPVKLACVSHWMHSWPVAVSLCHYRESGIRGKEREVEALRDGQDVGVKTVG